MDAVEDEPQQEGADHTPLLQIEAMSDDDLKTLRRFAPDAAE